ncbi:hypothetical protein [Phytohabitans houttuyneae]|uniref:Uncharacterized protein n=1 Tax=Phytohabitans houttuyneae TaxID=1076126 RepID=A0A6V8KUE3_9ACTN|nr:hypothetical protein [Phytohabitans houttuyneae]GFJ84215.1 hypothetical protein Phou_083950 [Phytohabitans houttuyneae]
MTASALSPLRPDDCRHCGGPVVWGTLQNGRNRCFDRAPQPCAAVAPTQRYAYSRRLGAVVCLDGERHLPPLVLRGHVCTGRQ